MFISTNPTGFRRWHRTSNPTGFLSSHGMGIRLRPPVDSLPSELVVLGEELCPSDQSPPVTPLPSELVVLGEELCPSDQSPNKKIALLFYGRIFDHKVLYDNLMDRLLDIQNNDFEIDIFISHPKDVEDELLRKVIELYKPVIIIRNHEIYDVERVAKIHTTTNISKHNTMCYYLSRYNLFNAFNEYILINNIKYDTVISLRMDTIMRSKFDINTLHQQIDNNILCIPNPEYDFGGMNDHFAIGNVTSIAVYMKMFEKIYELLEINQSFNNPETLMKIYLQKYNTFMIERCSIDYTWDIVSGISHLQLLLAGK